MRGISKILILGIILLILAGIIIVVLGNGFNVDLNLKEHRNITFEINKEFNLNDVKSICNEVFGNKDFKLKKVDLFNDVVDISVDSVVTDEEKTNLVTKMNEKFGTTATLEDLVITDTYNIRIRDLVKPYIQPVCISILGIIIWMIIRFRKNNLLKILLTTLCIIILTEASLLSIIVITRFPLSATVINLILVLAVAELIIYTEYKAREFKKISE